MTLPKNFDILTDISSEMKGKFLKQLKCIFGYFLLIVNLVIYAPTKSRFLDMAKCSKIVDSHKTSLRWNF